MVFETLRDSVVQAIIDHNLNLASSLLAELIREVEMHIVRLPIAEQAIWRETLAELRHVEEHMFWFDQEAQRSNMIDILTSKLPVI